MQQFFKTNEKKSDLILVKNEIEKQAKAYIYFLK